MRSTAALTLPWDATRARTHAALSVKPMSLIWASWAAYVSSGFAKTGGVGIATGAGAEIGAGAGAFVDPVEVVVEDGEGKGEELAHGLAPAPAPSPAPCPPSNEEKSSPPAAGGVPGTK